MRIHAVRDHPKLLIADEPTTALGVTIQAQVMKLIGWLCHDLNVVVMLLTHDPGVVAGIADRIAVMYAGHITKTAPAEELLFLKHDHS